MDKSLKSEEITDFGGLTRSQLMSRIRSKGNATTEQTMVALLRKHGLSGWRRHYPVAGRPDFVWRQERVALFLDGCFWHGHGCGRNLVPVDKLEDRYRQAVADGIPYSSHSISVTHSDNDEVFSVANLLDLLKYVRAFFLS